MIVIPQVWPSYLSHGDGVCWDQCAGDGFAGICLLVMVLLQAHCTGNGVCWDLQGGDGFAGARRPTMLAMGCAGTCMLVMALLGPA